MINKTAIIILNFKNYTDTIECISSVLESENKDFTIFIVDNASKNNSLEHIYEKFNDVVKIRWWDFNNMIFDEDRIILIQNDENLGYANGNNIGLEIASELEFEYMMVLNNDTIFKQIDLNNFINVFDIEPDIFCVGPLILDEKGHIDKNCSRRRPKYYDFFFFSLLGSFFRTKKMENNYYLIDKTTIPKKPERTEIISGACMFFKTNTIKKMGFFDSNTFLYYEEAILHEKARSLNLLTYITPNVELIHSSGKSTSHFSKSCFLVKCEYESLMYYLVEQRKINRLFAFIISINQFLFYHLKRIKESV